MINAVLSFASRRKYEVYEHYHLFYGQVIKKRRLELNLTQEYVANAICSNTYISKTENNQIVMGEDQLFQIMERLDIPKNQYARPEELVYYLERIIVLYYYKDLDGYKKIFDKVADIDFQAVIEVVRLGYLILSKEYSKAYQLYNELLDYLNSLDDLGFEIFLIFSADLLQRLKQLKLSRFIIESIIVVHSDYPEVSIMIEYIKFVIYGRLHLFDKAWDILPNLTKNLMNTTNITRLNELTLYKLLFLEYKRQSLDIYNLEQFIKDLDQDLVTEFLLVRAIGNKEYGKYKDMIDKEAYDAIAFLTYLQAKQAIKEKNQELYTQCKEYLSSNHYRSALQFDYVNLLTFEKNNDLMFLKDYLVNSCLKFFKKNENIFYYQLICNEIVDILSLKNRYKDALTYLQKSEQYLTKLQKKDNG